MGIIQIDRVVNEIDSESRSLGIGIENITKKLKVRVSFPIHVNVLTRGYSFRTSTGH
jgi:hypothetical protein